MQHTDLANQCEHYADSANTAIHARSARWTIASCIDDLHRAQMRSVGHDKIRGRVQNWSVAAPKRIVATSSARVARRRRHHRDREHCKLARLRAGSHQLSCCRNAGRSIRNRCFGARVAGDSRSIRKKRLVTSIATSRHRGVYLATSIRSHRQFRIGTR